MNLYRKSAAYTHRLSSTEDGGVARHSVRNDIGADSFVDGLNIEIKNVALTLQSKGQDVEAIHRKTTLFFNELTICQGSFIAFVGKSGKGKTTLLQLLGGARLPPVSDSSRSTFFIPLHLRVLHVPAEPMFVYGNLYENLTYGVADTKRPDGQLARVEQICRRLGISEEVLNLLDPHSKHEVSWELSLSGTEKHLLAIARALIANPQILCIHKPTLHVGPSAAEKVIELLREFVDKRGIEQSQKEFAYRRPRTCIITSTRADSLSIVDTVYKIHAAEDGEKVPHIQEVHMGAKQSDITLDDLC